jgi:hypothetical protein
MRRASEFRRDRLSPLAGQLRHRAASQKGIGATEKLKLLLDLDSVRKLAGTDEISARAGAFELLLSRTVRNLRATFEHDRERFPDPVRIARILLRMEPGLPSALGDRRAMLADELGLSVTTLRTSYEYYLWEHIGDQLKCASPIFPDRDDEFAMEVWFLRVGGWGYTVYAELDRLLHTHPDDKRRQAIDDGGVARLLYSLARFAYYYETQPKPLAAYLHHHTFGELTADEEIFADPVAKEINLNIWSTAQRVLGGPGLAYRDLLRLRVEFDPAREGNEELVYDFLLYAPRGRMIYDGFVAWLRSCSCAYDPVLPPTMADETCGVHMLLQLLEGHAEAFARLAPESPFVSRSKARGDGTDPLALERSRAWVARGARRFLVDG